MSAEVIQFPGRVKTKALRIPLFGVEEVKLTVALINLFGHLVVRKPYWCIPPAATDKNLKLYTPEFVLECLRIAHESELFSAKGRKSIMKIVANIEEIEVTKEA